MRVVSAIGVALLTVACAGPGVVTTGSTPSATSSAAPTPAGPSSFGTSTSPAPTTIQPDLAGKFDVGGHSLYIECYGADGPVMVFDAGSGGSSELWKRSPAGFVSLVDNRYRRCLYDRANLGNSDRVPGARTSQTAADELRRLLKAVDLPRPYVLVGRSFGGYHVRLYAASYPSEVTALILIETLTPEFHGGMKLLLTPQEWAAEMRGLQATEAPMDIMASTDLVAAARLPDVPLLVVAGTKWHSGNEPWPPWWPGPELDALWDKAQLDLGASVPRGRTVVFEGGDHSLQVSQPERLAKEINDFVADLS